MAAIEPRERDGNSDEAARTIGRWLEAVRRFDERTLENDFLAEWHRLGNLPFVMKRIAPFLTAVGEAWARGELTIAQEHFASEWVRQQMFNLWRPLSNWNRGDALVLTTLPGEQHDLGLHIIACIAAECGYRLTFLGANTPLADVAGTVALVGAKGVLISASAHYGRKAARQQLTEVCTLFPPEVRVLVGGRGAPAQFEGVTVIRDLARAYEWLKGGMPSSAEASAGR